MIFSSNFTKFKLSLVLTLIIAGQVWSQKIESVRPWLGVAIKKGTTGVLVTATLPDTPALNAGILKGDEITKVDSVKVETPEQLISEIAQKGVGFTVSVEILRAGETLKKKITLVVKPSLIAVAKKKLLGFPSPQFSANVIKGRQQKTFHIKEQLGKVTLLEFWATWCVACVAAHPQLASFAKKYKNKIDIIAISGEELPVLKKYLHKLSKITKNKNEDIIYLQSPESAVNEEFFAGSIPMFILIDKKGIVRRVEVGAGSVLENILKDAIDFQKSQ